MLFCAFCDAPLTGLQKRCCGSRECLLAMGRDQFAKSVKASSAAIAAADKADRAARAFAGVSFTDDPRAVEREAFLRMLPEPAMSLTGCTAQMAAASRAR